MPPSAWSDAVLALCALATGMAHLVRGGEARRTVGLGLLFVGVAAAVGTARFSGQEILAPLHAWLASLASLVGLPLVGAGWLHAAVAPERARPYRLPTTTALFLLALVLPSARIAFAAMGMLAVIASSVRLRSPFGAIGALLTILAGLVIGTEGVLAGLPRVAWFHLTLALGSLLLAVVPEEA